MWLFMAFERNLKQNAVVLPEVGSLMGITPGLSLPSFSASLIMQKRAIRFFTEEQSLKRLQVWQRKLIYFSPSTETIELSFI